jgi:hypothetical protein
MSIPLKFHPYTRQLEMVLSNFDRDLDTLAETIRTDILIPFCRKYGATYTSGNGTFFITRGKHTYGAVDATLPEDHYFDNRLQGEFADDMRDIMALLNEDISHNDCLGYRVGDVRKRDYK